MDKSNHKGVKDLLEKIQHIEKELTNIKFQIFKSGLSSYYFRMPFSQVKPMKGRSLIEKTAGILKSKVNLNEIINEYEPYLFASGLGK